MNVKLIALNAVLIYSDTITIELNIELLITFYPNLNEHNNVTLML